MKILVIGKNGQCAQEINALRNDYDAELVFAGSDMCDVTRIESIEKIIENSHFSGIINCAAYTAVDDAEDNEELAFAVNRDGVANLDAVARKYGLRYIHVSTDYVFNGQKRSPYMETDETDPIGVYGRSKLAGEQVVVNSDADGIVIRTAWLYSSYGSNFMKTMLRLAESKNELNVVNDQIGTPTYARDLGRACLDIITQNNSLSSNGKVYHFANQGQASWYDFAKEIFRIAQIDCIVNPIAASEYPTKATRPKYSVLDCNKIKRDFNIASRDWKAALKECLSII